MNWRTAHRNRQRAMKRAARPVRRPLFTPGWREWLIVPRFVSTTVPGSLWERILERASSYRERNHFGPFAFPRFDTAEGAPVPQSDQSVRFERRWVSLLPKQIWMAQKGLCAECKQLTPFGECTKRSYSFEIICKKCFAKARPFVMIIDDIDFPDPPSWKDVKVKYWDIVPSPGDLRFSMPARHTKEFIYGDNWNAFRRVS